MYKPFMNLVTPDKLAISDLHLDEFKKKASNNGFAINDI